MTKYGKEFVKIFVGSLLHQFEKNTFKDSSQNFNPGLPANTYNNMNYGRQQASKSDYEKYLWLFGGGRV